MNKLKLFIFNMVIGYGTYYIIDLIIICIMNISMYYTYLSINVTKKLNLKILM